MKHLCVSVVFLSVLLAGHLARAQSLDVLVQGVVGDYAPSFGIYMLHEVEVVLPEGGGLDSMAGGTMTVSLGEDATVLGQGGDPLGLEDIQGGMAVRIAGSLLNQTILGRLVTILEQ